MAHVKTIYDSENSLPEHFNFRCVINLIQDVWGKQEYFVRWWDDSRYMSVYLDVNFNYVDKLQLIQDLRDSVKINPVNLSMANALEFAINYLED